MNAALYPAILLRNPRNMPHGAGSGMNAALCAKVAKCQPNDITLKRNDFGRSIGITEKFDLKIEMGMGPTRNCRWGTRMGGSGKSAVTAVNLR